MKNSSKYSNGQVISEQNGEIKAQGKYVDGLFQGKWIFNKKEGYLWNVGHFKDSKKHGKWIRYKSDGSIEKEEVFDKGKKIR